MTTTGDGFFKFALTSKNGQQTFWANDGVTLDGSEPTTAVPVAVTDGFFSVNIGDTATTNMAALDPTLFDVGDRIKLRVWFNNGVHGFQKLPPETAKS